MKVGLINAGTGTVMQSAPDRMMQLFINQRPFKGECIQWMDSVGKVHRYDITDVCHPGVLQGGDVFDLLLYVKERA